MVRTYCVKTIFLKKENRKRNKVSLEYIVLKQFFLKKKENRMRNNVPFLRQSYRARPQSTFEHVSFRCLCIPRCWSWMWKQGDISQSQSASWKQCVCVCVFIKMVGGIKN